jgi:hypothetical protein
LPGLATFYTMGDPVHGLPVIAIVVILLRARARLRDQV